nr:MAG TPA: hypothetical protein [Caudoviricetes sp.]
MLNKVVLPYTIWYTGLEKILRLNLDKGIDSVTNISTKATLNGSSVNDLVSAIFNPKTKSIDITIRSDSRMDVDGEMQISLSYSDAKTHESILVVSVRSHDNISTENPKEVKQTKLTVRNGISYTIGAADEQVVYSFNLVDRNVTDEFATYGDVKDMLIGLGVTDNSEKDQYTILLEGDNLVLSKENNPSYRKIINLAKYHDEVSGEPLNVEDLKRDILSIVDGKLPNIESLKSDILSEAATKDAQLKVDILHEVDGKIPNADTIKQDILADVNPRIPDKDTLKTEILESAGEKDTALKTAILEEVSTRTTANNQSLKQEIMGEVDSKLPNTAVLKENILGDVDTKITTNNQTFKSTVMSEVDAKIPDVSGIKSEILNEVNPRLLDKETLKQEILSAIPTPTNYTLTMEEDNLVLGKEGDTSYRKVINLSKYRDEVTGQTVDVEQIKKDILATITIPKAETIKEEILQSLPTIPNYTLTLNENTLTLGKEGDSEYAKTIDLSKYVNGPAVDTEQLKRDIITAIHVPDEATIKQNILAEVNPKLIDKDIFKQEILSALPAKDEYSLELTEDTLVLTKTNDPSYRKEINLAKYHDEVGQPVNVESLKSDILSQVDTKISAIPPHTVTSTEVITALNAAEQHDIESLSDTIIQNIGDLTFHKETDKYVVKYKPNDTDDDHAVEMVEIPFTSLREIPTATQAEPVTLEKIFELMNDDSKANILNSIRNKLEIPEPLNPNKLISNPIVANGVLQFNNELDTPTVDFTNDFYTKAKVDELLRSLSGPSPSNNTVISGTGRPDANDHPNNNAPIGTIFVDTNSTHGASVWYKHKTNAWKVIVGDTGWIDLKNINTYDKSKIQIRRINDVVYLKFGGLTYGLFGHIPYGKMISKKEKNKVFRIVDIGGIPIGFRSDDAYIGSIISDIDEPGSIVASYYVGGQSDSNFIKVLYNNTVPEKDVKDLRPQPGSWTIGNNQSWPKI